MSYKQEKYGSGVYSTSQLSPNGLVTSSSSMADDERKDLKYKKIIRVLRFVSRTLSLILNGFMIGTMCYSLAKYYLTKSHLYQGQPIWVTPTTLWPTFMLLAVASVTFLLNFVTLCAYCCGVGAANKANSVTGIAGYVLLAGEIVAWAVTAGLFKMANTGSDLWGYSCGDPAAKIEDQVKSFVDFGKLCETQTGSWYASIINAVTYLVTFITVFLIVRRASHQKKMAQARMNQPVYIGTTHGQY